MKNLGFLLITSAIICVSSLSTIDRKLDSDWNLWKKKHKKNYNNKIKTKILNNEISRLVYKPYLTKQKKRRRVNHSIYFLKDV
jgi:hypothetical protein